MESRMSNTPIPPPGPTLEKRRKTTWHRLHTTLMEAFGLSRGAALSTILSISVALLLAVFWFFYSAPKKTITITSGPDGSTFQAFAERYRALLASNGVTLK